MAPHQPRLWTLPPGRRDHAYTGPHSDPTGRRRVNRWRHPAPCRASGWRLPALLSGLRTTALRTPTDPRRTITARSIPSTTTGASRMKTRATTDVPMHPLRCAAQKSRFSTVPWRQARLARSKTACFPCNTTPQCRSTVGFTLPRRHYPR